MNLLYNVYNDIVANTEFFKEKFINKKKSVFLMNGTERRSFSHFRILSKITYRTLAEIFKLTNFEVCLHSL